MIRLGVLVSGSGTNLQAIVDAVEAKRLDAEIAVVISNRASAFGLDRAKKHGIPTETVSHRDFATRDAFDAALVRILQSQRVDWVVLAGFMRIVTATLLDAFPMRVINIHPSLLPAFPGVDAQRQALEYGVRIAGCTVHLVDTGADTGPILAQAAVPVWPHDTEETLRERILVQEHELLPRVLQWLAERRLEIERTAGRPRVLLREVDAWKFPA